MPVEAGKTPTALTLGRTALDLGWSPIFLTRGYRGSEIGPLQVMPDRHTVADVGDEALLLARIAPTIVSRDRPAGARLAEDLASSHDGGIIIMDDGFQNPYLYKDFNLVVVDAAQSIGNGFVMPAGPLRVPLLPQVRQADMFLVVGEGERAPRLRQLAAKLGKASNHAYVKPARCHLLGGTRVMAFCGIGQPEKFFLTVKQLELDLIETRAFPDHHAYSEEEAASLLALADAHNLTIVTTAKDHVRLANIGEAGKSLARLAHVIEIDMVFDDAAFPRQALEQAQRKFSRR